MILEFRANASCAEKGCNNEGSGIGQEDLRQVQGDYSRRRGTRNL
jgi:hypothetical protein